MRTKRWLIDIDNDIKPQVPTFAMKQGDSNTNSLIVEVYNRHTKVNLSGKTVTFLFSNGTVQTNLDSEQPLTVTNNVVTSVIRRSVTQNAGDIEVEITIADGEKVLTTQRGRLLVLDKLVGGEVTEPDIPLIESLMVQITSLINIVSDLEVEVESIDTRIKRIKYTTWADFGGEPW